MKNLISVFKEYKSFYIWAAIVYGIMYYLLATLYWDVGSKFSLMRDAHKEQTFKFRVDRKVIETVAHKRSLSEDYLLITTYDGRYTVVHNVDYYTYNKTTVGSNVYFNYTPSQLNDKNEAISIGYDPDINIRILRTSLVFLLIIVSLQFSCTEEEHFNTWSYSDSEDMKHEWVKSICSILFVIAFLLFCAWFVFLTAACCDLLGVLTRLLSFS